MKKRKQNKKQKSEEKRNFFAKKYSECWNYIKESRNFIYAIIGIFFGFSLAGFFLPVPEQIVLQILKFIEEILSKTDGMNQFELIKFIFLNNLQSSFTGMIFGVFLGVFPILGVIVNGYILGFVASISVQSEGIFVLWRLFPHGIFELPAVFISLGLGLKFGTFMFQKNKSEAFRKYLFNSVNVFLFFVIPLLIAAAVIEGSLIYLAG